VNRRSRVRAGVHRLARRQNSEVDHGYSISTKNKGGIKPPLFFSVCINLGSQLDTEMISTRSPRQLVQEAVKAYLNFEAPS
jgi:hypothetical protein